ncbi:conserved Plasmodium protein, unknown function [Plasmodium vivax]|uniref:Sexual stage-specific protein G37 n=3 Tax=Plasmodium vivax TaxID=5855 RepID=A0A0J9T8P5_PLAVI|nr:hypothetical protein PVIIG_01170 [Plasmodium vivax India VII]KMZ91027.1 hypothetical protein PVMG_05856 [Plasmodium vivax Mauritania I]SCO74621.1 conserved Plasmodium protein, unknown function [Plasmodium vivax]
MKVLATVLFLFLVLCKKRPLVDGVIQKQDAYLDDEFRSFTYFFASSPSASFLSRIVHSDESRFTQTQSKIDIWSKTVDKAYSINQFSSGIMKVYMSLLLLLLLPLFAYVGVFGHTRNQTTFTLSAICAYFTLLVVFFLTNGILSVGLVCSLPLVFAVFAFNLAHSDYTIKSLSKFTRYVFSFVLSKFLYDIATHLGGDKANAFDYGLSGYLYMSLLKGNYYLALKAVHLLVLSVSALIIRKLFPRIFDDGELKSPQSAQSDKYIVSFLCALPIAASVTQIYCLASQAMNPIDPSIFFMIPSSVNFSSPSTIFSLWVLAITTYVLTVLRNLVETDYNHALNKIPSNLSEFL